MERTAIVRIVLDDLHRRIHRIRRDSPSADRVYGTPARRPLERRVARGPGFLCPVCGQWFRRFLPFGLRGRRNARCPGCGSLERHRFMWLYLRDRQAILRRKLRILHVAPEPCIRAILEGRPGVRYVPIDRYDPTAAQMDLTNLPFAEASFDLVLCSHVLEHIVDDRRAMREMARVLCPDGCAVVMVPLARNRATTFENDRLTSPAERLAAFGHPFHVRICGRDYGDRLSAAGFEVKEVWSTQMPTHRRRIHRISRTMLYHCRRLGG